MSDYLGDPPEERVIPVTKGCGKRVTINRVDDVGDPVDYGGDVFFDIDIDKTAPTRLTAVVDGDSAEVVIPFDTADLTKTGMAWRAILSVTGTPPPAPILVGSFERHDGGSDA